MNRVTFFPILFSMVYSAFAADIIPLLPYEYVSLDKLHYHNIGTGIVFLQGDMNPPIDEERNSLVVYGSYNAFVFNDDSDLYHKVIIAVTKKTRSHYIIGVLNSASDEPLYIGGLRTAKTGLGYGYEIVRNKNLALTLGAIAYVGDFGIEMGNGNSLPIAPLPIVLFNFTSTWLTAYFEFFAEPSLNITVAPESKVRLTNVFRMEQFRDIQDIYFDLTLWYRFFSKEHKLGDFAGAGLGVKNKGVNFIFGEKDKAYGTNYYAAYGILDLSFLNINSGYVFKSREIFNDKIKNDAGNGFYISTQLAWKF